MIDGSEDASRNVVHIDRRHLPQYVYIEGYRKAAELLTARARENPDDLDLLLYPIGYMFRHYVELHLKYLRPYRAEGCDPAYECPPCDKTREDDL